MPYDFSFFPSIAMETDAEAEHIGRDENEAEPALNSEEDGDGRGTAGSERSLESVGEMVFQMAQKAGLMQQVSLAWPRRVHGTCMPQSEADDSHGAPFRSNPAPQPPPPPPPPFRRRR